MSWRYATPEESEAFSQLPEVTDWEKLEDLFLSAGGSVISKDGEEVIVPRDMHVKLLREDGGQSWVYRTRDLQVLLRGAPASLRPGVPVAIFRSSSQT